jgi:hypothetical protein
VPQEPPKKRWTGGPGCWSKSRRLQHQNPYKCRCSWQSTEIYAYGRSDP